MGWLEGYRYRRAHDTTITKQTAPVYEGHGTAAGGTGSLTPSYPSGCASGDLLIIQITVRSATAPDAIDGWSDLYVGDSNGTTRQYLRYKFAGGGESGTVSVTFGADTTTHIAVIWRFSGVPSISLIENASHATGSDESIEIPSVTTSRTNGLVLAFTYVSDNNSIGEAAGESGGTYVEQYEYSTSAGSDGAVQLQTATMATAGTISGGVSTQSAADPWGCRTLALMSNGEEAANYQMKMKVLYDSSIENIVEKSDRVATLPLPTNGEPTSLQTACYYDGTYLHVWYGCHLSTDAGDKQAAENVYYTKSSYPFTSWDSPTKVIDDATNGLRDLTILIVGTTLYLFVQQYTAATTAYDTIKLYKIGLSDDFTASGDYTAVGTVLTVGAGGTFDEVWVASPVVRKIGSTYWMLYEAKDASANYSVGRAYASNVETLPWTKDGQLDDDGSPVINPNGAGYYICPDNFYDDNTCFFHIEATAYPPETTIRVATGNFAGNDVEIAVSDCNPMIEADFNDSFNCVSFPMDADGAVVENIDGIHYCFIQSWNYGSSAELHIYDTKATCITNEHCKTDFGDVRFTSSDGTTELSYWMREYVEGDYAIFWVLMDEDPATTGSITLYCYYGNSGATTTSDITIFPCIELMDEADLSTRWDEVAGTNPTYSIDTVNHICHITDMDVGAGKGWLSKNTSIDFGTKFIIEDAMHDRYDFGGRGVFIATETAGAATENNLNGISITDGAWSTADYGILYWFGKQENLSIPSGPAIYYYWTNGGYGYYSLTSYYEWRVKQDLNTVVQVNHIWVDEALFDTNTVTDVPDRMYIGLERVETFQDAWIGSFLIRKFNYDEEPMHYSWDEEEETVSGVKRIFLTRRGRRKMWAF